MRAFKTVSLADVPLYCPPCTIEVGEKYIFIRPRGRFAGMFGQHGYWIRKSGITTPSKILGWLNHLSSKNWMDAQTLAWFAEAAFGELGVKMDYRI